MSVRPILAPLLALALAGATVEAGQADVESFERGWSLIECVGRDFASSHYRELALPPVAVAAPAP